MESKYCPRCREVKPRTEFVGRSQSYCRPCFNAYNKAWREKNPEKVKATRLKHIANTPDYMRRMFLSRHGFTEARFQAEFDAQGRVCAICGAKESGGNGWHIDHDHACCNTNSKRRCGKCFRGILCSGCNTGLGHFKDDVARLLLAAAYLSRDR